jgi:hypothetical protein
MQTPNADEKALEFERTETIDLERSVSFNRV